MAVVGLARDRHVDRDCGGVDGMPQMPTTGKVRAAFAASAGPPAGPAGLRVSATRQGVTVKNRVGDALFVRLRSTGPPGVATVAVVSWARFGAEGARSKTGITRARSTNELAAGEGVGCESGS